MINLKDKAAQDILYECEICCDTFKTEARLDAHADEEHPVCESCGNTTGDESACQNCWQG